MRLTRLVVAGVAGLVTTVLAACGDSPPTPAAAASSPAAPPSVPAASPTTAATTAPATTSPTRRPTTTPATTTTGSKPGTVSDVSALKAVGIDIDTSVILDVADDGVDRFLQVGRGGVVDFTGTTRTDSTMMALRAAEVKAAGRVVIKPPFWNEDLGAGSCVADTSGAALKLETCRPGKASQTWQVIPAGDSGQFELKGAYGILSIDNGKLTTGSGGRTGLQTLDFAS
ncbi:hypothetical protein [Actinoplanes sp. HUAS TT8]|uniref:hypothetical protein n=1 Tax=Actinoplanes sp. HUAS TT8 TaxID=3447453 RepID=UPI003F5279DE